MSARAYIVWRVEVDLRIVLRGQEATRLRDAIFDAWGAS